MANEMELAQIWNHQVYSESLSLQGSKLMSCSLKTQDINILLPGVAVHQVLLENSIKKSENLVVVRRYMAIQFSCGQRVTFFDIRM